MPSQFRKGHISLCPRDTLHFEKHLSPLVPVSSPSKLVSDTLDFFSFIQRPTTLNRFIKQSPTVPLVRLQMQHPSICLVLWYEAVRELHSVRAAMDKSRVWPPALWEWPDCCAGERSLWCSANPSCWALSSLFSVLYWPLLLCQLSCLKQPKVLCGSHMEISRERQLTPTALPRFFLILLCLAWGAIPGLGKWRIRKNISST